MEYELVFLLTFDLYRLLFLMFLINSHIRFVAFNATNNRHFITVPSFYD